MANINWKLILFWVALWYFVYSAPTEGVLNGMFNPDAQTSQYDDF